jgi:hypothetical protein
MRDPTHTAQHLDPIAARAVCHAIERAGGIEQLRIAHLVVGLLLVDGGFVLRKLRDMHVDRADLVREVYADAAATEAADPADAVKVVQLAAALASATVCINTQHLLAAILLEESNRVAVYLTKAGIDRLLFVRRHFPYLRDANQALEAVRHPSDAGEMQAARGVLAQALSASNTPQPPPTPMPRPTPVQPQPARYDTPAAEITARQWLRKLISSQADQYDAQGYVDVRSALNPGRSYRIYRDGYTTSVYEAGRAVARSCLKLRSPSLPPTDRVIAEYFLIRGDEPTYVATANIARC